MRKELIAHRNPKSPNSEIFRTLRTNIQFMNTNKKLKTLLVTSTFPGEGKSWVASNLAVTFAQAGKKVILVDADMRKGRQYSIFGVSPKPGLSNYLAETEIYEDGKTSRNIGDYIQETEIENLYVISAGNVPPNPSELLVSTQMIKMLDDLKELCDLVIIDGTPCELVADSIILSRIVDSCIIITAHKITKKDALERVIKNIRNVGGKLAGVVINRVPTSKGYGSRYYYYGDNQVHNEKSGKFKNPKILPVKNTSKKQHDELERDIEKYSKTNEKFERIPEDQIPENISDVNFTINGTKFELERPETNKQEAEKIDREKEELEKKQTIEKIMNGPVIPTENKSADKIEDDKPFVERANEIMKQINDYINEERKNL